MWLSRRLAGRCVFLSAVLRAPLVQSRKERVQVPDHTPGSLVCLCVRVCVAHAWNRSHCRHTRSPHAPHASRARVWRTNGAATQPDRAPAPRRPFVGGGELSSTSDCLQAARPRGRPPFCRRALTPGQQQQKRRQQRQQPDVPQQPAHGAAVAARSRSGAGPRSASGAAQAAAAARARLIGPRSRHSPTAPPGPVPRARPRGH